MKKILFLVGMLSLVSPYTCAIRYNQCLAASPHIQRIFHSIYRTDTPVHIRGTGDDLFSHIAVQASKAKGFDRLLLQKLRPASCGHNGPRWTFRYQSIKHFYNLLKYIPWNGRTDQSPVLDYGEQQILCGENVEAPDVHEVLLNGKQKRIVVARYYHPHSTDAINFLVPRFEDFESTDKEHHKKVVTEFEALIQKSRK